MESKNHTSVENRNESFGSFENGKIKSCTKSLQINGAFWIINFTKDDLMEMARLVVAENNTLNGKIKKGA